MVIIFDEAFDYEIFIFFDNFFVIIALLDHLSLSIETATAQFSIQMAVILPGEESGEFKLALSDEDYIVGSHTFLKHYLIQVIFYWFDK